MVIAARIRDAVVTQVLLNMASGVLKPCLKVQTINATVMRYPVNDFDVAVEFHVRMLDSDLVEKWARPSDGNAL